MIKLNIHEAKTHLSRYLVRLSKGESIILCKRNSPIAEIKPLVKIRKTKRPIGLAKGKFDIHDDFFLPLPENILSYFGEKDIEENNK